MIPCFWDSYSIEELKWPPQQLPNANIWIGDAYKILKFAFRFAAVYSHAHGATNPDHRLWVFLPCLFGNGLHGGNASGVTGHVTFGDQLQVHMNTAPTWELLKLVRVRVSVRADVNRIQARRRLSLETCGCFGTASWDGESFPWSERSLHVRDDMLKGETVHVVIVCNDIWHNRSGVFLRYICRQVYLVDIHAIKENIGRKNMHLYQREWRGSLKKWNDTMYLSIRFGFVWAFKLVQMEHLYKFCQILNHVVLWSH